MVYYGKAPNAPPAGNVTLKLRAGQAKTQNASAGWWKKHGAGGKIATQRETEEQEGLWRKAAEVRKQSGMTQETFAEQLHVSRQAVSRWESGRGYPEIEKILYICHRYHTTLDALFADELPPIEAEEAEVEQPIARQAAQAFLC